MTTIPENLRLKEETKLMDKQVIPSVHISVTILGSVSTNNTHADVWLSYQQYVMLFYFSYEVSNTYVMNYTGRIDATIVVPIYQKISNYEKIQRHHSIQRTKWVKLTCFGFISYYILHIL